MKEKKKGKEERNRGFGGQGLHGMHDEHGVHERRPRPRYPAFDKALNNKTADLERPPQPHNLERVRTQGRRADLPSRAAICWRSPPSDKQSRGRCDSAGD